MKLSLMSLFFSICTFVIFQSHCLSLLITLEAMMLSMLLFTCSFFSLYSSVHSFWFLCLLTLAACEAAMGLSLLVSILRVRGSDQTSFLSMNMFFAKLQ
uniref:NADH dehydrogenase subunit 4L n=1 Tax=Philine kinglipini TaxID=3030995 RepID=UPI002551E22A|nr:NADH dehydrogenase subunit 4L [Philine kinglipini]WFG53983.1 NADH dehydrogenase subunit 4L [Philine kinglipini]